MKNQNLKVKQSASGNTMKINEKKSISALLQDDFSKISELIQESSINALDRDGRTLLINCVIKNKNSFISKLLKYKELNINTKDDNGFTALHFAVEENRTEILKKLILSDGLEVNLKDKWGNTPLWRAVHNNPENKDIIWALIKKGADVTIENEYGVSPLNIMQEDNESGDFDYEDIFEYINLQKNASH